MLGMDWLKGLRKRDLTEPQAQGGMTGVRRAWAEEQAAGLTPSKLAAILRDCDGGNIAAFMDLAMEMEERDPHYMSVLGQRKRAISGITPVVTPASENKRDQEIAAWVRDRITGADAWPGLVEDVMDAVGKGFSVIEIGWQTDKAEWVPTEFVWRPQRFFVPDRDQGQEIRLLDDADTQNGIALQPGKFICHKAKLKSGPFFRGGIARTVAFSWMCKAYSVKDWMAFIELYGLPLRLGRYGPGATEEDISTLFRAVANIGTDAAAVIPADMSIEFVDAMKGGGGSQPVFENLARYLDEQISKAVLGQTMTSDDGGSMAQAKVHNEVRLDIAQADARDVSSTIRRDLIAPAVALNFGADVTVPKVAIAIEEPEDTSARIEDIAKLADRGVTFKASEARALVRMSDPADGDEVFGGKPDTPAPSTARIALARAQNERDILDEIRDDMLGDWRPVMSELIDPVRRAIEGAESYEQAFENIAALDDLPSGALIEALVQGMFKSRAVGDVQDG